MLSKLHQQTSYRVLLSTSPWHSCAQVRNVCERRCCTAQRSALLSADKPTACSASLLKPVPLGRSRDVGEDVSYDLLVLFHSASMVVMLEKRSLPRCVNDFQKTTQIEAIRVHKPVNERCARIREHSDQVGSLDSTSHNILRDRAVTAEEAARRRKVRR